MNARKRRKLRMKLARHNACLARASVTSKKNKLRKLLLADSGGVCKRCGVSLTTETVTVDHIVPVAKSGAHTMQNLQALCRRCNGRKGDKLPTEHAAR